MSAILWPEPLEAWSVAPMLVEQIDAVEAVERVVYEFPWTAGNFRDSLTSGYQGVLLRVDGAMAGYAIQMYAIDEAHLLNITIVPAFQRLGHGSRLLQWLMDEARSRRMSSMFLEVRPSNSKAQSIYMRFGFGQVGIRRDYYPARDGRENALVLTARL
jgi:[ribosomal protein S18]-alanine N-acetyltransferase